MLEILLVSGQKYILIGMPQNYKFVIPSCFSERISPNLALILLAIYYKNSRHLFIFAVKTQ